MDETEEEENETRNVRRQENNDGPRAGPSSNTLSGERKSEAYLLCILQYTSFFREESRETDPSS